MAVDMWILDVHIIAVLIWPRTEMHIGRGVYMLNTNGI
jgi:hypothetical protein